MEKSNDYFDQVKAWLNTPKEERDLDGGAKLMLQGNRNRILHQNVLRKQNFDKIEYELLKIVGGDAEIATAERDAELQEKTEKEITEVSERVAKGKRDDHDSLPDGIKSIPEETSKIYSEMRSVHERLKILSSEDHTPADRLPHLKNLLSLNDRIRELWDKYDGYVIADDEEDIKPGALSLDAKAVSSHRKYLSSNKAPLQKLIDAGKTEEAAARLAEMQRRFDACKAGGVTFDPKQLEEFANLGLNVG